MSGINNPTSISGGTIDVLSIGTVSVQDTQYASRVDDNGAGTIWMGEAAIDSNEGSSVWRIKRVVETNGTTDIKWADGANFSNIWTNHGTLTFT